jgi:hypothetical protein
MANNDIVWARGEAYESKPSRASSGGTAKGVRTSVYGDLAAMPIGKARVTLADEGSYFVATNPTPGTGLASIAAADGVDDEEALIYLRNENATGSGKRIYLDYLRIQTTVAGASGTNLRWVAQLDSGSDRYSSGGTAVTPVNVNMASTEATGADLAVGAVVLTAETAQVRLLGNGLLRPAIAVAGDTYLWDFGGAVSLPTARLQDDSDTANILTSMPPVVLGPGDAFYFQLNGASQDTAAQYEFDLGYWER